MSIEIRRTSNMRQLRLLLIILVFLPIAVRPSSVSQDGSVLAGVWEAITPYGNELLHIEIAQNSKESFLLLVPSVAGADFKHVAAGVEHPYSLKSMSIEDKRVTMKFVYPYPGGNSITIVGRGEAEGKSTIGVINGTMQIIPPFRRNRKALKWNIFLKRGSWTRNFDYISKFAEDVIRHAKEKANAEQNNNSKSK